MRILQTTLSTPRHASLVALVSLSAMALVCSSAPAKAQHFSFGCRNERQIALTFDDGPNPPYTEAILGILASRHARATFFDEGQAVEAHPELVQQEIDAGMAIGSHSYAHSMDLPTMPRPDFARDLKQAEVVLSAAAGFKTAIYRAPYGHTSDSMLIELRRAHYASIGWDIDSTDWSDATADVVVSAVLDNAHPGAIVLMHDGGVGGGNPDRTTTLAALPRILDGLRDQGYELVTVPELTGTRAKMGDKRGPVCSAN